jgi:hypothetical protein
VQVGFKPLRETEHGGSIIMLYRLERIVFQERIVGVNPLQVAS